MRRRLFFWALAGFLFVGALGTLLHFVYEWSGEWAVAAAFSAVNESTWEHMKLLFFSAFFFTVIQVCVMGETYPNLLAVRTISLLAALALIPMLYYTYTGALGCNVDWFNILIFFLADLALFALDFFLLRSGRCAAFYQQLLGLAILWALAFAFVWCTFHPPLLPLWQDPVRGAYGLL